MSHFSELTRLEELISTQEKQNSDIFKATQLETILFKSLKFPIWGLEIGNKAPKTPTLALFAGIHGLESIGTRLLLAYLEGLFKRISWDENLKSVLNKVRILAIPIVNPTGMFAKTRSNYRGIDLNRNSPVEAMGETPFLGGGHRLGSWLPWYRGIEGEIEKENKALFEFCHKNLAETPFCFALDVHSGFGVRDRLWYPYAKSKNSFPLEDEALQFKNLLRNAYPFHVYKVEAQSVNYTTHGDVWDHIFDLHWRAEAKSKNRVFIPWTLEMGSWNWIRKNPVQLFSSQGIFNPTKAHRYQRTIRRHRPLIDFFMNAVINHKNWIK